MLRFCRHAGWRKPYDIKSAKWVFSRSKGPVEKFFVLQDKNEGRKRGQIRCFLSKYL